jgi:hypothetical protein
MHIYFSRHYKHSYFSMLWSQNVKILQKKGYFYFHVIHFQESCYGLLFEVRIHVHAFSNVLLLSLTSH